LLTIRKILLNYLQNMPILYKNRCFRFIFGNDHGSGMVWELLEDRRLKILIIDDDEEDFMIIRDFLFDVREVSYQVDWVGNYQAALDRIILQNYDACLVDYRMGKYNGVDLLKEAVKIKPRLPIILLTGISDHQLDVAAMEGGAADFLVKGEVNSVILERAIRYSIGQKKMEEELYNEKERAIVTLDSIGDAVITTDIYGRVMYLNRTAQGFTGWSQTEVSHSQLEDLFKVIDENTGKPLPNLIATMLAGRENFDLPQQALLVNRSGKKFAVEGRVSPICNRENHLIGIVIVFRDVTANREMSRKISYQANHDPLTGLINRINFEQQLNEAIAETKRLNTQHALFFLDLDHFKIVNDTCGHIIGDQLLKEITVLIRDKIRKTDIFARMGGDEFAVLLPNCPLAKAGEIAGLICEAAAGYRFIWKNHHFAVGISIGINLISAANSDPDIIMANADEACYIAKNNGGNGYHIYQWDNNRPAEREIQRQWILNLNHAFSDDLFRLFFQPIIPVNSQNQTIHYELLLRLLDQEGRLLYPSHFLPAANRYKLMSAIDRWVISRFFAFYREVISNNPTIAAFVCNINLSGSFLSEENSLKYLEDQIMRNHLPPQQICFEITETNAIDNFNQVIGFVERLKKLGCRFALDDFGNGLATFTYLKKLPVDFVKIDGSFVRNILTNSVDCAMVDSINQIAHLMNIRTVAEFVENEGILRKIKSLGVDFAQGYWIDKPQPLDNLEEWGKRQSDNSYFQYETQIGQCELVGGT
jgi:diguanylate cyclase (GGDEF)-like protein/PAS domain S-box-containing protein